jgi:hypothetical protein
MVEKAETLTGSAATPKIPPKVNRIRLKRDFFIQTKSLCNRQLVASQMQKEITAPAGIPSAN